MNLDMDNADDDVPANIYKKSDHGAYSPQEGPGPLNSLEIMRRSVKSIGHVDGQGEEKLAFGKVLRSYRLRRDLTQEQLGWQARIDRKFISAMERGRKEPGLATLLRISRTLGVPLGELMDEVERELQQRPYHERSDSSDSPHPSSDISLDTSGPGRRLE